MRQVVPMGNCFLAHQTCYYYYLIILDSFLSYTIPLFMVMKKYFIFFINAFLKGEGQEMCCSHSLLYINWYAYMVLLDIWNSRKIRL